MTTVPSTDYDWSETTGECAIFQIFADDAISTPEGKSMTAMAKEAFNKKKALYIIK